MVNTKQNLVVGLLSLVIIQSSRGATAPVAGLTEQEQRRITVRRELKAAFEKPILGRGHLSNTLANQEMIREIVSEASVLLQGLTAHSDWGQVNDQNKDVFNFIEHFKINQDIDPIAVTVDNTGNYILTITKSVGDMPQTIQIILVGPITNLQLLSFQYNRTVTPTKNQGFFSLWLDNGDLQIMSGPDMNMSIVYLPNCDDILLSKPELAQLTRLLTRVVLSAIPTVR